MSEILLLGNGFDLWHLLPTKYHNFLNTVNFLINNYSDDMKTVGDVFGNEELQKIDGFIAKSYGFHKDIYNKTELEKDDVKQLIKKAKDNSWFKYLSNSFNEDVGWIDFEKEIADAIQAFKSFFESKKTSLEHNDEILLSYYIALRFGFISYDRLDYYAHLTNSKAVEAIEVIEDDYIIELPVGSKIYMINREKIVDELYDSLRELADCLKLYLMLFIEQSLDSINLTSVYSEGENYNLLRRIRSEFSLSFNYTKTFEKIYKELRTNGDGHICHIHGKIDDDGIVLGVNPDTDDDVDHVDTLFLNFKKYYQRVFFGTDLSYLNDLSYINSLRTLSTDKNDDKFELCVIGHSLDATDKDIITELFGLSDKISIYYHNKQAVGQYIKNLVNIYGKDGFDNLRVNKRLEFEPLPECLLHHN